MAATNLPPSPGAEHLRLVARVQGPSPSTEGSDPHPAWFAEWRALVDRCNGPEWCRTDPLERLAALRRIVELEGLAASVPARTLAGATAQLRFARGFVVDKHGTLGSAVDDEAMLDAALATLERLAGEAHCA